MDTTDFNFEFTSEISFEDEGLRAEAETRLRELAADHTDIIGAATTVEELTGSETPHAYRARVVVYMRPNNIAAVEKDTEAMTALQQALSATERQVRDYREKLRERWKQP